MQPTKTLRSLLVISGLIAIGLGASILFAPTQFHASHGIELGTDASSLSEVRAPGGALLVLGFLMLIGVIVRSFTLASTSIAALQLYRTGFSAKSRMVMPFSATSLSAPLRVNRRTFSPATSSI